MPPASEQDSIASVGKSGSREVVGVRPTVERRILRRMSNREQPARPETSGTSSAAAPARNLELKVRCSAEDLSEVRHRLMTPRPTTSTRLSQIDHYFGTRHGRLKLRVITPDAGASAAELIAYTRPAIAGSRWSDYHRLAIPTSMAKELANALTQTLGLESRVAKQREVIITGQTRVHLDIVDRLGAFVELETLIGEQSEAEARDEHAATAARLGLERFPAMAGSYADLLVEANDTEKTASTWATVDEEREERA